MKTAKKPRRRRPGLKLLAHYEWLVNKTLREHSAFEFGCAIAFLEGARRMRDAFVKHGGPTG